MATARCHSVTIEGMRVPVENVIIELRLPAGSLHAGELVGWETSTAAIVDAREIGDTGFRVTQVDPFGLPRAENPVDWKNTEESLEARIDSETERLTDFEKKVLLRGTPLGHGRYTFLLTLDSAGDSGRPSVTAAELKKLRRFSPRALVFTEPVSVGRAQLPGTDDLDYRSVLGAPVAFDAKRARGAAGRRRNRPGNLWEAARGNPEVLAMLLQGISPGSSETPAHVKGTRRANAEQMAWILRSPDAANVLSRVLGDAKEVLDVWVTDADVTRARREIRNGRRTRRHFVSLVDRYDAQEEYLDTALRVVRGFADLAEVEPEVLAGFLRDHDQTDVSPSPGLLSMAESLGYVSAEQAGRIRHLSAQAAATENPTPEASETNPVSATPVVPARFLDE